MNRKIILLLEEITDLINKENLSISELKELIELFLYSLGASIEGKQPKNSEDVLVEYFKNPTLGNALMAQALMFRDKWNVKQNNERKKK